MLDFDEYGTYDWKKDTRMWRGSYIEPIAAEDVEPTRRFELKNEWPTPEMVPVEYPNLIGYITPHNFIEELVRRKKAMKDNILVIIGDKAYKPRAVQLEVGDIHKNWMHPFNEYKIEVTECPSAERVWTPDKLRRVYSEPEKIIFNGPATIVFWKDGTKTVVKAGNEAFDPEKGIAMAYLKKFLGNKGNYFNTIKKAIKMAECVE